MDYKKAVVLNAKDVENDFLKTHGYDGVGLARRAGKWSVVLSLGIEEMLHEERSRPPATTLYRFTDSLPDTY